MTVLGSAVVLDLTSAKIGVNLGEREVNTVLDNDKRQLMALGRVDDVPWRP